MSELSDSLRAHGQRHMGTDLGGLLQWAALHIDAQDEALEEVRAEYAQEESARKRLESALHSAMQATESAAQALMAAMPVAIELGRDYVSHINIMAAHGDQDYLKSNGMSVRHIDLRSSKPRKKKEPTP